MSARGCVRITVGMMDKYSSDMSARGRVCLTVVTVDTALTRVRVDACVLNNGHGGYSSDMSARGRVCLTVVMVDTGLT